MFNVVALGLIFMLLFTAFAPSQNLQSTVNSGEHGKDTGTKGLGALYITFAVSTFVAPSVAYLLGERLAMLTGTIGYALFVASNILDHAASYFVPLFVAGAVANGFGAAILWTGQGSFLTKNSTKETMGRNNGIFFSLFQISQLAGNLMAAFLLPPKGTPPAQIADSARIMFIVFASIAAVAVVSFFILRKPPPKVIIDGEDEAPIFQRFLGLSQAYFAGTFTAHIGTGDSKRIGYVMACFGAADALASVGIGKIMDVVGRKIVLFSGAFFVLVPTSIISLVDQSYFLEHLWLCILCGIIFGISDACFNTLIPATLGVVFEVDPENAFGAFKLVQATTSAVNYFLGMSIYPATLTLNIFLLVGSLLFFVLDELPLREKRTETTSANIQFEEYRNFHKNKF